MEVERDETGKKLFQARKNLDRLEVEQQEEALEIVIHSLQQCLRQIQKVSDANLVCAMAFRFESSYAGSGSFLGKIVGRIQAF